MSSHYCCWQFALQLPGCPLLLSGQLPLPSGLHMELNGSSAFVTVWFVSPYGNHAWPPSVNSLRIGTGICSSGMLEPGSSEASRTRQGRDQACILSWFFVHVLREHGHVQEKDVCFGKDAHFGSYVSGRTFQGIHRRVHIAEQTTQGSLVAHGRTHLKHAFASIYVGIYISNHSYLQGPFAHLRRCTAVHTWLNIHFQNSHAGRTFQRISGRAHMSGHIHA